MAADASEQMLIPSAGKLNVATEDQGLRTHARNGSSTVEPLPCVVLGTPQFPQLVYCSSRRRFNKYVCRCELIVIQGVVLRTPEGEWLGAIRAILLMEFPMDEDFLGTLKILKLQASAADQPFLAYLIGLAEHEAKRVKGLDGGGPLSGAH
jgi:hypothetical protein